MNTNFTRVECSGCGSVYSVFTSIDDDRYSIEYCSYCGEEEVDTFYEEVNED